MYPAIVRSDIIDSALSITHYGGKSSPLFMRLISLQILRRDMKHRVFIQIILWINLETASLC